MSQSASTNKKDRAAALFSQHRGLFCCPRCGKSFRVRGGARLVCKKDHSFDISKNGYVNFAGGGSLAGYDAALFAARRAVLDAGFYDGVAQALGEVLRAAAPELPAVIVDAGCGEGYYLDALSRQSGLAQNAFVGVDLSRDAVTAAARRDTPACWCVADIAALPLQKHGVDVLLNILTPANYAEFKRVLRPGGLLLKVVPGRDYLREIRAAMGAGAASYDDSEVVDYAARHIKRMQRRTVRYMRPLSPEQLAQFWAMTPLTAHAESAPPKTLREITIDLQLLWGSL